MLDNWGWDHKKLVIFSDTPVGPALCICIVDDQPGSDLLQV